MGKGLRGCGEVLLTIIIMFGFFAFVLPVGGFIAAMFILAFLAIVVALALLDHLKK